MSRQKNADDENGCQVLLQKSIVPKQGIIRVPYAGRRKAGRMHCLRTSMSDEGITGSFAFFECTEILAEKGQHVVLKSVCNSAGVRALVDLETVRDAVPVEHVVQLARIESESV